ncbi:G-protein coupled receptor Mth2-like [Musca vetustissima]|uniref:G-protein coupled receptor Mth2-like n=1 Tax=Musca vetustissima TaxID=27455 RepID=UPI002AB66F70|nr:G-protein coupled receptor Mth2-like [Musca vetustissima]
MFQIFVSSDDGSIRDMHLIDDFYHINITKCPNKYPLLPYENEEGEEVDEWTYFENGTLWYNGTYLNYMDFCFDITYVEDFDSGRYLFYVEPHICYDPPVNWNDVITGCGMLVSVPFFLLTIFSHSCILKAKSNLDKCMIPYLGALSISYSVLGFLKVNSNETLPALECVVVGYINYFCVISYLVWNCIICFDIWSKVTSMLAGTSFVFLKYVIVGLLVPLTMTGLTYVAQTSKISEDLTPGINADHCSIETSRWSALIYLYGPCLLAVTFSIVLYCKILRYMHMSKRNSQRCDERNTFYLNFRLFVLMCATWSFEIISYFLKQLISEDIPLYCIPDILNATQGITIFYLFVCRKNILATIRNKLKFNHNGPYSNSVEIESMMTTN